MFDGGQGLPIAQDLLIELSIAFAIKISIALAVRSFDLS